MKKFDLAWINKLDSTNDIWSVQTRDKQFYQKSCSLKARHQADGYIALIEFNGSKFIQVVNANLLQLPGDVVRSHFAWRQPDQLDAQGMLWHYAAEIQDPALKELISNIMSDAKIMHSFYKARASKDFHHNEQGGLFKHSIKVALTARLLANSYDLERGEIECAFVCGLLHDIGKIQMFYNTDKNQQKGVNGQHEAVIPPFITGLKSRYQATMANFCLGVMPPSPILGRSLL